MTNIYGNKYPPEKSDLQTHSKRANRNCFQEWLQSLLLLSVIIAGLVPLIGGCVSVLRELKFSDDFHIPVLGVIFVIATDTLMCFGFYVVCREDPCLISAFSVMTFLLGVLYRYLINDFEETSWIKFNLRNDIGFLYLAAISLLAIIFAAVCLLSSCGKSEKVRKNSRQYPEEYRNQHHHDYYNQVVVKY